MKNLIIMVSFVLMILSVGCEDVNSSSDLAENVKTSECGGFESGVMTKLPGGETEDCSQKLIWSYDESSGVLNIINEAVNLNCCGKHDVNIEKTGEDEYEYIMVDNADNGMRCGCDCLFDFEADIAGVDNSSVKLRVYTDVEEEAEKTLYWEGTLDLTKKNGTVIVKERTGDWCSEFPN
ncbi:MAG TPA: hypothetical protein VLJ60_09880 [bacterium]|nr:hypothetical protein [bacterium]